MADSADLVHPESQARWGGWSWSEPFRGEHFRRCSYCGSVNPDDLAAEPTWRAEWADRKYGWPHKFYVGIPNRDPDALFVVSSTNGPDPHTAVHVALAEADRQPGHGWFAVGDLTAEQRAICERDGWGLQNTTYVLFGTRANHFGKFYTIHLADLAVSPEVKRAIERGAGLHFEFRDGRVSWSGVDRG